MPRRTWHDTPATDTPLAAAFLNDLEDRKPEIDELEVNASLYGTLQQAIDAAIASTRALYIPAGEWVFSSLSLVGCPALKIRGDGINNTHLRFTSTTGRVIDMEAASFVEWSDLHIRPTTQKTAGEVFYLDAGAGSCQRNSFRRMRISSPYKGWNLVNCTTTTIEDIQLLDLNSSWTMDSFINLSGATTSTHIQKIVGGSGATVTNALIFINGAAVDTVHVTDLDLLNLSPSTGCKCIYISNGQWMKFTNCSLESGTTEDAITINGGRAITFTGLHALGQVGAVITAGNGVTFNGGEITNCRENAISLGGGTHHKVMNMVMADLSLNSDGTYPGVFVSANVTDFDIIGNTIGANHFAATKPSYCVDVSAGTSDRYRIKNNNYRQFQVAAVRDLGTGTEKSVDGISSAELPVTLPAAVGLNTALAATMTAVANANYMLLSSDFGGGTYQIRAVAMTTGQTTGDSMEVEIFNTDFSNVPAAAIPVAAPDAANVRAISAWYTVPTFRVNVTIRVRNATAARGNVRHVFYELRKA